MRRPVLPNSGPSLAAGSASLRHQLFDSSPEAAAAFSIVRYSSSVTLKLMCRVRFVSLIAASSLVLVLLIAEIAARSPCIRINRCKGWTTRMFTRCVNTTARERGVVSHLSGAQHLCFFFFFEYGYLYGPSADPM